MNAINTLIILTSLLMTASCCGKPTMKIDPNLVRPMTGQPTLTTKTNSCMDYVNAYNACTVEVDQGNKRFEILRNR